MDKEIHTSDNKRFSKSKFRQQWFVALNRFGLGAKFCQIENVEGCPKEWLKKQLVNPQFHFDNSLLSSGDILNLDAKFKSIKNVSEKKLFRKKFFNSFSRYVENSLNAEITTNTGFELRVLNFFSNHFSVSKNNTVATALAPTLEREAIAPNIFGHFKDMVQAVVKHPTMLLYLNNVDSYGPNSKIGKAKNVGLNENLAREILELHTLGIGSGYTQADVEALASGITGWTIGKPSLDNDAKFLFRSNGHEPGSFTLLDKQFNETAVEQGEAMISYICAQPSTANYVCSKLVEHFVGKNKSDQLVKQLVTVWQKTNGNLREVFIALIDSEISWDISNSNFKLPREYVISVLRALPPTLQVSPSKIKKTLEALGQGPFMAGSPAGYEADESYWNTPVSILNRIDWVSTHLKKFDENYMDILNSQNLDFLIPQTYGHIFGADTRTKALLLFLVSPDFMRR